MHTYIICTMHTTHHHSPTHPLTHAHTHTHTHTDTDNYTRCSEQSAVGQLPHRHLRPHPLPTRLCQRQGRWVWSSQWCMLRPMWLSRGSQCTLPLYPDNNTNCKVSIAPITIGWAVWYWLLDVDQKCRSQLLAMLSVTKLS